MGMSGPESKLCSTKGKDAELHPGQAQADLERQRAAQRMSDIRRKKRILEDPEYHEQSLTTRKIGRDEKKKKKKKKNDRRSTQTWRNT
jgi:hypothetical protein